METNKDRRSVLVLCAMAALSSVPALLFAASPRARPRELLWLAALWLYALVATSIALRQGRPSPRQTAWTGVATTVAISAASAKAAGADFNAEQVVNALLAGIPILSAARVGPRVVIGFVATSTLIANAHRLTQPKWSANVWLEMFASLFMMVSLVVIVLALLGSLEQSLTVLERASETDPLTELLNRRGLVAHAQALFAQTARRGRGIGLLALDVDYFKNVNDKFGHAVGDAVLAQIAEVIRGSVGGEAVAARVGGEEFVVAWPVASEQELVESGLGVRRQVELRTPVTISVGALYCPCPTRAGGQLDREEAVELVDCLIRQADSLLYAAKRGGRNCVCSGAVDMTPSQGGRTQKRPPSPTEVLRWSL